MSNIQLYKRYVRMITLVGKNGEVTPLYIVWDNNVRYKVDKVLEVRKAFSPVGGAGILYRCRVEKHGERNIYLEKDRWFIESHKP